MHAVRLYSHVLLPSGERHLLYLIIKIECECMSVWLVVHVQYSTVCVLVMCRFSCFLMFFFVCACVWLWCGFWTNGQFCGSIIFLFHFHVSVYSYLRRHGRVAGHAPQVLPYIYIYVDRVYWGQRLQVKGHGGVSSTFNTLRPSQGSIRPQVSPLVGKYSAYIRIYTAGKLGLGPYLCSGKLTTIIIHQVGDGRH